MTRLARFVLVASLALASPAAARTSQQLASAKPGIFLAGERSQHTCALGGSYVTRGGGSRQVKRSACTDIFRPLPVQRGSRVTVRTAPAARTVTLSSTQDPSPWACIRTGSGEFSCPVPRDAALGAAGVVRVAYDRAASAWTFDIGRAGGSGGGDDDAAGFDSDDGVRFRLDDKNLIVELDGAPAATRRELYGRSIRAACGRGPVKDATFRQQFWPSGSPSLVFVLPSDVSRIATFCLLEDDDGKDIAFATLRR